jgi:hypothetical protein
MGKRFVRTADVDKRAIQFCRQFQAIEKMPLIHIQFSPDNKSIDIFSNDGERPRSNTLSVEHILLLDVEQAKANGGTFEALLSSRKIRKPKPRFSQAESDKEVQEFLTSEDQ